MPRSIEKEIVFTLTWIGQEFGLNLLAQTYVLAPPVAEGEKAPEQAVDDACTLSFANPYCKGMQHLFSRDPLVLGDSVKINSDFFYDESGALLESKGVLLYVMDAARNREKAI